MDDDLRASRRARSRRSRAHARGRRQRRVARGQEGTPKVRPARQRIPASGASAPARRQAVPRNALTQRGARRAYTYNVFDQTVSLTPPLGGTVQNATYLGPNQGEIVTRGTDQYSTNVLGIGVKVYSDATVSYFTRDENGALLSERAPGGARYYYVPDGLGSTIATTATGGATANSYKYDPYGGIVTENETSVRPASFRFAGGLYSSSVALHKFGQRWYDQSLDRWTQQDAIDQAGDLKRGNRYLYVGDNPVNSTDPSGLLSIDVSLATPIGGVHFGVDTDSGDVSIGPRIGAEASVSHAANNDPVWLP
jgi:RHS repeat-associated protein